LLIGYSLGGIIMLEVARRLLASGENVGLLVLVDSYPYRTQLKFAQRVRLYSRLSMRKITNLLGIRYSSRVNRPVARDRNLGESLAKSRELEKEGAYSALKSYEPSFYDGPIKFVRAEVVTNFPADARAVWAHLVEKLDVETMKGNHIEMIGTNFALLAPILSRYIAESDAAC
jgi:thioesterase domain-containing protein